MDSTNWARIIIGALVDGGVDHFFISPGYRDVPLITALNQESSVTLLSCFDERAAGFAAISYGQATGRAAALVCTSGTAGANYLPAVVEAYEAGIPLIVLTADRPVELSVLGANQTTKQLNFFSDFINAVIGLEAPNVQFEKIQLRETVKAGLRQTLIPTRGPVQINIPLRAPLEPIEKISDLPVRQKYCNELSDIIASEKSLLRIEDQFQSGQRVLVLVGRLPQEKCKAQLSNFLQRQDIPFYLDICSSLCLDGSLNDPEIAWQRKLISENPPDIVIQFGSNPVSKYWHQLFKKINIKKLFLFNDEKKSLNTQALDGEQVYCNDFDFLKTWDLMPWSYPELSYYKKSANQLVEEFSLSWAAIAKAVLSSSQQTLFLANSSAVRAFDTWVFQHFNARRVYTQRGVSGIEGHCASGLGLAMATVEPVDVVLGDVALLHDLNSLFLLAQAKKPVRVICVNNQGGKIFAKLPIAEYPEVVSPFVDTPHDFRFSQVAKAAQITYYHCSDRESLESALVQTTSQLALIEVSLETEKDLALMLAISRLEYLS